MKILVIAFVRLYQSTISPLIPQSTCRYTPTCSTYMIDAVTKYGAVSGVWRGLKRIGRCHPFHPGGYDPA